MSSLDLIRMGVKNLWRRKLRTFLTVLGVIIGTASIMVMVSLGLGMNSIFEQQLERMGSLTVVQVHPGWGGGSGRGESGEKKITDSAVSEFSRIPNVVAVSPFLQEHVKVISGKYESYLSIVGIRPDALKAFDFEVQEGELLKEGSPGSTNKVEVLFGSSVKEQFWDPNSRHDWRQGPPPEPDINLFEDRIEMSFDHSFGDRRSRGSGGSRPKIYRLQGVGILKQSSYEVDYSAFMDMDTFKKLKKEYEKEQQRRQQQFQDPNQTSTSRRGGRKEEDSYSRANIKVDDVKNVEAVQKAVEEMGFSAYSLTRELESMKKTSMGIQAVLGGIGAISLLVAALGITNTMIMSIYERTREIGVMKVIGAALRDIRRIFLFEAGMIGFLGGLAGLAISYLISFIMNKFGGNIGMAMGGGESASISIIPIWLSLASLVFTTFVGLVSGFYPARRAMKLSALEAIKTE
ncbi:MAG: ABC transporter permease [Epulopiscium sp.]|nr:ABC transporter permease [Candidatus Epulonipiscium sp.]